MPSLEHVKQIWSSVGCALFSDSSTSSRWYEIQKKRKIFSPILANSPSGSIFTFFLHDPLDAFCFLVSKNFIERETYYTCTEIVNRFFAEFSGILFNGDMRMPKYRISINFFLAHVFLQFMADPLLCLLIMRFCFFYATVCLLQVGHLLSH